MANDKLYLRCTKCNATVFLSKWTPQGGAGFWLDDITLGQNLNKFLEDHTHSNRPCARNAASLGVDSGFVVDTEESKALALDDAQALIRQRSKTSVTNFVAEFSGSIQEPWPPKF